LAAEIELTEDPIAALADHARVSIAFDVDRVIEIEVHNNDFVLSERRLDVSYRKDYDEIPGEGPASWAKRFNLSNWGLIGARLDGRRVGGAVIAFNTDPAVLWDIRVAPELRQRGIGSALFRAAEAWAAARGCRRLEVETQNVNVAACRFYARRGCALREVKHFTYPALPGEIQMIWHKEILPRPKTASY
jgi:GNAT superfamily N-acetyltransferase